jgi:hypothetical protein
MSTAAVQLLPESLASVLRHAAADAVGGSPACLWCGSGNVMETDTEEWPPAIVLACADCGCQASLDRRLARAGRP